MIDIDHRRHAPLAAIRVSGTWHAALWSLLFWLSAMALATPLRLPPFTVAAVTGAAVLATWAAFGRSGELRFGPANAITLGRLTLVAMLASWAFSGFHDAAYAWAAAAIALAALCADGLDGYVARHTGSATAFGARFDMETDTALLLVLTCLLVGERSLPSWIVLAGLMRPAFLLAGRLVPWMGRSLPESRRRKLFCVAPMMLLIAGLTPTTSLGVATLLAALALAMLASSFVLDIAWLAGHRQEAGR